MLYETLRLRPPIWLTTREAVEDVTIGGLFIPKVRARLPEGGERADWERAEMLGGRHGMSHREVDDPFHSPTAPCSQRPVYSPRVLLPSPLIPSALPPSLTPPPCARRSSSRAPTSTWTSTASTATPSSSPSPSCSSPSAGWTRTAQRPRRATPTRGRALARARACAWATSWRRWSSSR